MKNGGESLQCAEITALLLFYYLFWVKNGGESVECAKIAALLLFYYCFTTALLLLYYCITRRDIITDHAAGRPEL